MTRDQLRALLEQHDHDAVLAAFEALQQELRKKDDRICQALSYAKGSRTTTPALSGVISILERA